MRNAENSKSGDHSKNNPLKNNGSLPPLAREAVRTKHVNPNAKEANATVPESQDLSKGASRSRTSEVAKGRIDPESSEELISR